MNDLTTQTEPLTYERLMASMYENDRFIREKFAETDRLFRETREEMKETDRLFKETREEMKETDRLFKETREDIKETDRIVKNLSKQLGGMANSNGDVAETFFMNSFSKNMKFAGQEFDHIDTGLRRKNKTLNLQAEYDIVMYNCSSVAIIEIKYKADKEDVELSIEKVKKFKKLFPQYQDYDIYLGLAGLSIVKNAEKEAIKHGIAIIKQVGDTVVINDAHLKAF